MYEFEVNISMTQKRAVDRSRVIEKSIEIINRDGLNELTMPNLANELGIKSQSLYHYVANRQELLSLVCANRLEVLQKHLVKKIMGLSGTDALFTFADEVRIFLLQDKVASSIFYNLNSFAQDSEIRKEVHKIIEIGEQLDVDKKNVVSVHSLLGAVLGYVFLDSTVYKTENASVSDDGYHEMLLRLVSPKLEINKERGE